MKKCLIALLIATVAVPSVSFAAGLTTEQIQAILGLLRSFGTEQGVINNVQTALTGGTPNVNYGAFCHTFSRDLTVGDSSPEVQALAQVFALQGMGEFYNVFNESTAAAVVKFQAKYGIRQTGYVGPLTRAKLNALYGCGTTNTTHPSITVLSPNGGEVYIDSSIIPIKYSGVNLSNELHIEMFGEYGTSQGVNIVAKQVETFGSESGVINNRTGTWTTYLDLNKSKTVDVISSGKYKINLYDEKRTAGQDMLGDTSDSYFTITSATSTHPSITVLSPNGGETWQWGQNYQITWASNPAGTVVDVYYVSATLGTQYAAIRNLTGQNNITVVAGLLYINGDGSKVYLSADSYKIKVCVTNTNTCDTSDSSFTIPNQTKPSITVLSPNGGEMWFEGTTQVIKWSAKLTTNIYGQQYTPSVFYIEALNQDKDAGTYTIAEASSYGSSYNWEVGTYTDGIASTRRMLPRGQYLVRVCEARTTNCDSSDSYFTITSPTTQPSTGTVLGEQTSASTLTQLQIDAIITLLRSLGVEQGALNNVDTSLHGGTPAF